MRDRILAVLFDPRSRKSKAGGARKRPVRYEEARGETSALLGDALRLHRKGSLVEASALYAQLAATDPLCLDAWMNQGSIAVLVGDSHTAIVAFARAQQLAPQNPRVLRDCAIGLSTLGDLRQARRCLEQAVLIAPDFVGALLIASRVSLELGETADAIAYAERAVGLAPDDPSAWIELHRASFVDDPERLTRSLFAAERAAALAPDNPWPTVLLAGARGVRDGIHAARTTLNNSAHHTHGLALAALYAVDTKTQSTRIFAAKNSTLRHALGHTVLPGPTLEFGVRYGVSTRVLAEDSSARVFGFDSFQGLPEAWLGRAVGAFSTNKSLPDVPSNVTLVVGLFADTLPTFVTSTLTEPPRLLHIDSDLYSSASFVLRTMAPWIRPGCVLVFDEFLSNARWRDDEFRALQEFVERSHRELEPLSLSWITGQAVFRVR